MITSNQNEQVKYWGPEDAGLYEETADGKMFSV